jgi:anaerobic magnesium-protoporphyrin IX monomethyl ester cyclase
VSTGVPTTSHTTQPNRKVVLITPYGIENRGLRYISARLREEGFQPVQVFLKRWVNNSISPPTQQEQQLLLDLVRRTGPLFIGIGFGAPYFQIVRELTDKLRNEQSAPVLWGGVHPTVMPEDCIPHTDYVCIGEGEQTTVDLAHALVQGTDLKEIPGLWIRSGNGSHQNPPRALEQNLDALPFPEYLQPDVWFIEDNRLRNIDPISQTVEYRIYPSRGCPYQCTYCHAHVLRSIVKSTGSRFYRIRSVENVIAELEYARSLLTIRRVKFDGDVFAFPKQWLADFASAYKSRIGIPFELLTYPGELDEEDLALLKSAGLRKIQTGIQSGSDREVLEDYGRKSKTTDIIALSKTVTHLGIEVAFDLIFDNPLASEKDKRSIVELLLKLHHPFNIYLYSLTLFPKTRMTNDLLEAGLITPDDVEGRATKSFHQFRLSPDWPRSTEDRFWIALTTLAAKRFVPAHVIRRLFKSTLLRNHPEPLEAVARVADLTKVATIALRMLLDGELTMFKIRQYGSSKKVISQ